MPDPIFADPRLAVLYDLVDDDRRDLDLYAAIVEELRARSVLDVGCGTGTLACRLARTGTTVVGVDPAAASLDVARDKVGADRVRWIHAAAADIPELDVDLAVMTGNVAMVFLTDEEWSAALAAIRGALHDGGWLVFETRDPTRRAWERWTRDETHRTIDVPGVGPVDTWVDLTEVRPPLVSFRHSFRFRSDGTVRTSGSTLRFPSRDEVTDSLDGAGFRLLEVRDAPDRPGLEHVFLAQRP